MHKSTYRPRLESLEDRTLLTVGVFNIDPTQSLLSLSGDVSGAPLQQQGAGSLMTTYEGTIDVDFDLDAGTISFLNDGSSAASADNSGNWQPRADGTGGAEPANYGAMVSFLGTGLIAVRNAIVNASTDSALPLSTDDGIVYTFPSQQTLTVLAGSAAYTHPILGHGAADISNNSAPNTAADGSFTDNGDGTFTLTAPVNVTIHASFSGIDATLNISGSVTAIGGPMLSSPIGGPHAHSQIAAALNPTSGISTIGTVALSGITVDSGTANVVGQQVAATDQVFALSMDQGVGRASTSSIAHQANGTHQADPLVAIDAVAVEMVRSADLTF